MLIVLDTNVLISGQLSNHGNEAAILGYHQQRLFQIVVNEEIFEEYARVLKYPHIQAKHHWSSEHMVQFLSDFRKSVMFVKTTEKERVSSDPDDDKFFHCAKAAQADFLVSGDRHHILPIPVYGITKTVTSKQFIDLIQIEYQYAA